MCTLPRTFIRIANVCYFPFVTLQHFIQVKATHTAKTYDSYFYPMVHITSLFSFLITIISSEAASIYRGKQPSLNQRP